VPLTCRRLGLCSFVCKGLRNHHSRTGHHCANGQLFTYADVISLLGECRNKYHKGGGEVTGRRIKSQNELLRNLYLSRDIVRMIK
jgi:hypothetical protein